ncbi:MAG: nucleotidyltransferase domain-containing protein [Halobacteria archaeon]|nr:nucleotidyltransferase domain-containing protein [Halobacteria archaeon]
MNTESKQRSVEVPLPIRSGIFRYEVTNEILNLLADNPHTKFSIRELSRATKTNTRSTSQAVNTLQKLGVVSIQHEGNRKLVQIDHEKLNDPEDPILKIPQEEFREPVRALLSEIQDQLDNVKGVLVFGSVARGEGDRQSDIDCFVLVKGERATNQRKAHELADRLREQRFNGERYNFQILVESMESAQDYGPRLQEVFANGITLYETDELKSLKGSVIKDGH